MCLLQAENFDLLASLARAGADWLVLAACITEIKFIFTVSVEIVFKFILRSSKVAARGTAVCELIVAILVAGLHRGAIDRDVGQAACADGSTVVDAGK